MNKFLIESALVVGLGFPFSSQAGVSETVFSKRQKELKFQIILDVATSLRISETLLKFRHYTTMSFEKWRPHPKKITFTQYSA